MRLLNAAAFVLAAAQPLGAQTMADLTAAPPQPGTWTYSRSTDGSEAVFKGANSVPQLWLRCTRVTRQIRVSKLASAATSVIKVWTSTSQQSLPAIYDAATGRVSFSKYALDPLFDALAFSRGRIGVAAGNGAPLVVPAWEEVARVIEDCRI